MEAVSSLDSIATGGPKSFADPAVQARREAAVPCDVCGKPHITEADHAACPVDCHSSAFTREWYMHMPYETPSARREAVNYGAVSFSAHEHPFSLLYGTQFFWALQSMFTGQRRPVVVVHNYCASDGMLKWMRRESYRKHTALAEWPLCMMSSAAEQEGAIPGLLPIFFRLLSKWLNQWTVSSFAEDLTEELTLAELFDEVERCYVKENPALIVVQSEVTMCLLCGKFAGREEQRWLCSACYRQWENVPESDRQPLPDSTQTSAQSGGRVESTSSQRPAYCKLGIEYGANHTAELKVRELFG